MSPISRAATGWLLDALAAEHAPAGGQWVPRTTGLLDREGALPLGSPGRVSPNRHCRLARSRDGWLAINLARSTDHELIPAWLEQERADWALAVAALRSRDTVSLVDRARMLGLPVAAVDEVAAGELAVPAIAMAAGRGEASAAPPRVVDLSALWAGPLCGALLAQWGAQVTRVASLGRPDPGEVATPDFFERLNGDKAVVALDLGAAPGRQQLADMLAAADIVITSARPRAFAALDMEPERIFAANPALSWVAITGYGWHGADRDRVAFGDDAAAAGGLLRRTPLGPRFAGDALADPLTGLAAALGAIRAWHGGGGVLVDAAMAPCAAGAARLNQDAGAA